MCKTDKNFVRIVFMRWIVLKAATTEPNSVLVDLRSPEVRDHISEVPLIRVTWDRKVACFLTLTLRGVIQPMTFALLSW